MGRLSARSNPTGLLEIERSRVKISVSDAGGERGFSLDRLDLEGKRLANDLQLVIVARAGSTSHRFPMGTTGSPDRGRKALADLDASHPLHFRLLVHARDNPRLVASLENIRAHDDANGESLLPMVPADLGERLWKLVITDAGPELQFNSVVFPNAMGAEGYVPFMALVLPEALHQVMMHLVADPGVLDDQADPWHGWQAWLEALGAEPPPVDDEDAAQVWCDEVVGLFCNRNMIASRLGKELGRSLGND